MSDTPRTDKLRAGIPDPAVVEAMLASHADLERENGTLRTEISELERQLGITHSCCDPDDLKEAADHAKGSGGRT